MEEHKELKKLNNYKQARRNQIKWIRVLFAKKERSPFTDDKTLRNIEIGMVADSEVNVDNARIVGEKIVNGIAGQTVTDISFKKKDQVVTLETKRPANPSIIQPTQVDPQLMFQRLTAVGQDMLTNTSELFSYELSSFPSSMFEANGLPKQAAKATLGDAIWTMGDCQSLEVPHDNAIHVIDGGSLLHRLPWTRGQTFSNICSKYVDHVKKRFHNPVVVMDGYQTISTKDITHLRRSKGVQSNTVTFTEDMPLRIKKETFLMNESNKDRFIQILVKTFKENNVEAIQADGDADLLIVQTAVEKSEVGQVVVYGEDTDLLVLLCHYAKKERHNIYFTSDKQVLGKTMKVWDISKTQEVLGLDLCHHLLFIHAITGCDTTSRLFGIGKPVAMKRIKSDHALLSHAEIFLQDDSSKEVICKAGEEVLVALYGGMPLKGLDLLRWRKFTTKTMAANRCSVVQVQSLPPTSDAASFHSMRVYIQCQYWKGKSPAEFDPTEWGWINRNDKLYPIEMSKQPAPDFLLKIIHCNCKTDCDSRRCTCRKNGIPCSSGCGECRGINCSNPSRMSEELTDMESGDDSLSLDVDSIQT